MITRRDALRAIASTPLLACTAAARDVPTPALAPGDPMSPERRALVDAFTRKIAGLPERFEKRVHESDWTMPYRVFRPAARNAPLVLYLHGSGGAGNDNEKQLGLGNIFGTLLWALPENQSLAPCCIVAPRTGLPRSVNRPLTIWSFGLETSQTRTANGPWVVIRAPDAADALRTVRGAACVDTTSDGCSTAADSGRVIV